MNSTFGHRIFKEKRLLVQYFNGPLTLQVAIEAKKAQIADPDYDPTFSLILDFRNTTPSFSKSDIQLFVENLRREADINPNRRAMITSTPNQAAYYMIVQHIASSSAMNYQVVSTIEAALGWIGEDVRLTDLIKDTIEEIRAGLEA
ncbi:MAG: hypothetical protein R2813_13585 [Flavobacteriales bacterium]